MSTLLLFWAFGGFITWCLFIYDCVKHSGNINPLTFALIGALIFVFNPIFIVILTWQKISDLIYKLRNS